MTMAELMMPTDCADRTGDDFALADGDPQPRLLLVGPDTTDRRREALVQRSHIGMVAVVAPDAAAAHLDRMALVDIVWMVGAEAIDDADLSDLCTAVVERGCRVLCETSLTGLDRVAASFGATARVEYLVECDDADRLLALAAVRNGRPSMVHDVARDGSLERIDQLQEEVMRISRVLGELTGQRGGGFSTARYDLQPDDRIGFPAHVHAPPRDFTVGPRSFVPEGRGAVLRNKAKRIRRIIRERRMREQFFPADLFADPAWDMLLDLYAARLEQQPVSVSSLCIAAAVPATTALRWIKTMTDSNMFMREADPHDGRRIFIALGDAAAEGLDRYFEALDD